MKPGTPVGVGVIGAGFISDQYLTNMTTYPDLKLVSVGDLVEERAASQAAKYGIGHSGSPNAVIDHPDVEIVVNLTVPAVHAEIAHRALAAGKHVWNEKPLATSLADSRDLLAFAARTGLLLGCAPDTFLGAGIQRTLRLIADGAIGTPLTANAIMQNPGPERWHPDPAFIFQPGVGPLFDIGPYYLTTLAQVFGPASSVSALSSIARKTRTIAVGPKAGATFDVNVASHTAALIEYASGGHAQATFSYQAEVKREGFLEITGTEGTLVAPDPNHFDGEITIARNDGTPPETFHVDGTGTGRGIGVLDIARASRTGEAIRATGELAHYVLELMTAIQDAADNRTMISLDKPVSPASLLPASWSALERTL